MPRARDLGLPFPGTPGPLNAITDVAGVSVGFCTLQDPARHMRTGVTAIIPRMDACLFYTFDAAEDLTRVERGVRRLLETN